MAINWKEFVKNVKDLTEEKNVERLIEEEMRALIRESHPNDYKEYMKKNDDQLTGIKEKLKTKYTNEIHERVTKIFTAVN